MTAQEIFDKIVSHLRTQNAVSVRSDGGCAYRSGDGEKKCAVGCLIPDDVYDPRMEGFMASVVVRDYKELAHLRGHQDLLESMQMIHDHVSLDRWEDRFKIEAMDHNLTYTPPIKVQ